MYSPSWLKGVAKPKTAKQARMALRAAPCWGQMSERAGESEQACQRGCPWLFVCIKLLWWMCVWKIFENVFYFILSQFWNFLSSKYSIVHRRKCIWHLKQVFVRPFFCSQDKRSAKNYLQRWFVSHCCGGEIKRWGGGKRGEERG